MAFDNAQNGGQAEARSFPHLLGRKEWFENLVENSRGMPVPVSPTRNHHIKTRLGFGGDLLLGGGIDDRIFG